MENEILSFAFSITKENQILAYFFFFMNSVLQIVFPPYPGDTIVIFEGYLRSHGILNDFGLIVTVLGTILGSILLYYIGIKNGTRIIHNKFFIKYFNVKKVEGFEKWFKKFGAYTILASKFIPGINSITLIAAGVFKVTKKTALLSIIIASIIHNSFLFYAGIVTGNNMSFIKTFMRDYNKFIIVLVGVFVMVYIYLKFIYKKGKPSNTKN